MSESAKKPNVLHVKDHPPEIADFPEGGERVVRVGMQVAVYPLAAGEHPFEGLPKL